MRMLVVEDAADIGEAIVDCVKQIGHVVDWARDGEAADRMLGETEYALAILDVMLPKMDGVTLLRRLRARGNPVPVLVVTARSAIDDRVSMLDLGADDYLVKPFDFRELEARIHSIMRRRHGEHSNFLTCGRLQFDRVARAVTIRNEAVYLTKRELSVLEILMVNRGQIFSKSRLLDQIIGYEEDKYPNENAVEVIVTRLRRKLLGSEAQIVTHRGLGYRMSIQ
jgi:two-component system response regulator TctD